MILVTGASGTAGGAVLAAVARSGAAYRAMFRTREEAAKAPPGTETVVADFLKPETLTAALRGVNSLYLVCSPIPELVELEGNMLDRAVGAGVQHVVLNSAMGAGDYQKSFPSWHRQVEDRLRATGLSWTILRPNSFYQNILQFYAPSIRAQGVFYGAMGKARVSFLDIRDIAAVAAAALSAGQHVGKIYELNGPQALAYPELAEKISQHCGRPVRYVDIPEEAQGQAMREQGMPDWQVTALLDLGRYYQNGKGGETDGLLERLLGHAPMTIDEFLVENAAAFRERAANA
jgi:uncharacterized protein YbjT (DUF2867 family)